MSQTAVLRPLILASTSRYRTALLERFGVPFSTHRPQVDEAEIAGEPPRERAVRLAAAKAAEVAARFPDSVVIGGDQVPAAHGTILHKPGNAANCHEQLRLLSGSSTEFYTACAVHCLSAGLKVAHLDTTTVKLRALTDPEIERYVEREMPIDCAGGFKAEALGITLFERMYSEDPTAIVGLPMIWLAAALRSAGYQVP